MNINFEIPSPPPLPLPQELLEDQGGDGEWGLFCDGACRGNPGPGAYASIGQHRSGELIFIDCGGDAETTNNRMELKGAISALREFQQYLSTATYTYHQNQPTPLKTYLYSDSQYLINGVNNWMPKWKQRGWKLKNGRPPENLELWQELDALIEQLQQSPQSPRIELGFIWVKGHAGHPQNEYCDLICNHFLVASENASC